MKKQLHTRIDEKAMKALDIKIAHSDYFKDRCGYLELLIKLLPFIPDDIRPNIDAKELMDKMCANLGIEFSRPDSKPQKHENEILEVSEEDQEIKSMAKNFRLKTKAGGIGK